MDQGSEDGDIVLLEIFLVNLIGHVYLPKNKKIPWKGKCTFYLLFFGNF